MLRIELHTDTNRTLEMLVNECCRFVCVSITTVIGTGLVLD